MAARRNVLNGASAWEREEKANQQRDYAAQLQAQVLQKQAKQEQEKARRQQEQREELEMLERERAAETRKHQLQQEQKTPEPSLSAPSPQHSVSKAHTLVVESPHQGAHVPSPLKSVSAGLDFTSTGMRTGTDPGQQYSAAMPTSNFVSESYTPTFNSTVSIFESLHREPGIGARSTAFYDDLAALQRLAVELDSAATQRRAKAQGNYVKPDFLHQLEASEVSPTTISPAALHSPKKPSETKVNQEDAQLDNTHIVLHPRKQLNLDGLIGESIMLPFSTAIPSPSFSRSKSKSIPRARGSPIKPPHRFTAAMETEDDDRGALENHSEMLHFTTTES